MRYLWVMGWFVMGLCAGGISWEDVDTQKLFSSVVVESLFADSSKPLHGGGLIIDAQGTVLTNAHLIYDVRKNRYAERIRIKVQEGVDTPPICFSQMRVKAADTVRDLALLAVESDVDVFCNPLPKRSAYHKEYFQNHAMDILDQNSDPVCPLLPRKGEDLLLLGYAQQWREQLWLRHGKIGEPLFKRDAEGRSYQFGFKVEGESFPDSSGAPLFDLQWRFWGLLWHRMEPAGEIVPGVAMAKPVIMGWLCRLSDMGIESLMARDSRGRIPLYAHPICVCLKRERLFYDPW